VAALHVLILAAGKGTRFKTQRSKLLFDVCGLPMVNHVHRVAESLSQDCHMVIRPEQQEALSKRLQVHWIYQEKPLGTGDAVRQFLAQTGVRSGRLLVLLGDVPLIEAPILQRFLAFAEQKCLKVALISTQYPDPHGYGRVIRDQAGTPVAVKEEIELLGAEKQIKEINSGIFLFDLAFLRQAISLLKAHKEKQEYFLTHLVSIAYQQNEAVDAFLQPRAETFLGVNTLLDLAQVRKEMQRRILHAHMLAGVDILAPDAAYIDCTVSIAHDVTILANNVIRGNSAIGEHTLLGVNNYICDCKIGNHVVLRGFNHLNQSTIGDNSAIGPYAHLRFGNCIGKQVNIGNFVEVKKSSIDTGSKVPHLSYIGDADIGREVNIGAGAITCNYDGKQKHKTRIQDHAFVGSDSQLVAPVEVGRNAYIASGSTITTKVPDYALAICRPRQRIVPDWVKKKGLAKGEESSSG